MSSGVTIEMLPLWLYFHLVLFVFQHFTKWQNEVLIFFFCLVWFWKWLSFCLPALLHFPKQNFFFKVTNDLQGLSFYRVCELWSRKYWRHTQFWGLHEDGARQGKPKGESRSFNWVVELHGSCSYRVRLIWPFSGIRRDRNFVTKFNSEQHFCTTGILHASWYCIATRSAVVTMW